MEAGAAEPTADEQAALKAQKDAQFAAELMVQYRNVDFRRQLGESTSQLSFQELKDRISEAKRRKATESGPQSKRFGAAAGAPVRRDKLLNQLTLKGEPFEMSKAFGKVDMPGTIAFVGGAPGTHEDHTIKRFRHISKVKTFDTSFIISEQLKKEIYRTPINDGSGHRIFNLGRDLAKGKPWYC